MNAHPRPHPRPLIDGLLDAPAVYALTSLPEPDLVACAEAVTAALVGSLSTGAPCLGREPEPGHLGMTGLISCPVYAERIAERLALWSELTALPLRSSAFAYLGDNLAAVDLDPQAEEKLAEVRSLSPALLVVSACALTLAEPVTSTAQAREIVEGRLRWLAEGASTAVLLDLSEITATGKAGTVDLYADAVDAVLAIDPDRPAVHLSTAGARVATYEPALGLVGEMAVVS
ncbi:hypothetical protein [Geodermatophilus sp. URMC 62]|uniref:hypothetical protein n=1 Tax=Geodermatophilus sp. URMC 62 TaxID=3423414 RepID=UPI00406BF794